MLWAMDAMIVAVLLCGFAALGVFLPPPPTGGAAVCSQCNKITGSNYSFRALTSVKEILMYPVALIIMIAVGAFGCWLVSLLEYIPG